MSDSPSPQHTQPEEDQGQVISLEGISRKYLTILQRRHDLLAYEVASLQAVDAEKYEYFARLPRVMPVHQLHADHATVQRQAKGKVMVQAINDLLGMSNACLDETHFLLCLLDNKPAVESGADDARLKVQTAQETFVNAPLQDKFELLEKSFGIMNELEDGMIALAIALRAMMTRSGLIAEEDLGDEGELVLEFKSVQQINPPKTAPEDTKPEMRVVDTRRSFRAGDTLELSNSELMGLSVTTASFMHSLFRSADEFGRRKFAAQQPAAN